MKRLILIAMLFAAPAHANDRLTLMLDWFVNPDHGPIIVAQQKGFFADEGLEVEIIAPADPADPPKMAAAGRADIAVSYQPQLHLMVAEGLPLTRVGTLIATPLNCLMVRADGPVQGIADLKGRKVGFSVAGVESAMLTAMLAPHGLTMKDLTLVNVNFALTTALLSEQVDAVIGAFRNFELTQMRLAGGEGRCIYPEEHGVPAYDELIYVANPTTMDKAVIVRFLAATERATAYLLNHPESGWQAFASYAPELDDALNIQAWADTLPRFALRPAALDEGRYARFSAFLAASGLIPTAQPVASLALDPGR
ncbi:MAG: putative hydroxymethylpyrimidine transport system substrate-binding protein [Paracoccaceae bacterium]|jgi:putative hydroxymethylpyrimidine transport system substrate-binding protein